MAKDMKRRSFLKFTAAGVSAAAAYHCLSPLIGASKTDGRPYVDRCTGKKVDGVPTTCAGCGANCGMIAYVRSGQLLKIQKVVKTN